MRSVLVLVALAAALVMGAGPAVARQGGGGGMNSGPYNTSAMVVMRERQERVRKCSVLRGFNSDTMTFVSRNGRRQSCP